MKYGRPAKFGSWHLDSDPLLPGNLDARIRRVFTSLSSDIAVWNDLTKRHRADLFCGLFLTEFNQGLALTPDTMAAIARRGLELSLDIYGQSRTIRMESLAIEERIARPSTSSVASEG